MTDWYKIINIEKIDSPALLVYPDRVLNNIDITKSFVNGDCSKLRPHVKTNKMREVCQMMIESGIYKFKCATIAEAEMLGICKVPDVLLAYQPVGPKIQRLINLVNAYPSTKYACLIDNLETAKEINKLCIQNKIRLSVYLDLNVGMGRTGILPEVAITLIKEIENLDQIKLVGLHAYDGHIHDANAKEREKESDLSFAMVNELYEKIKPLFSYPLSIVMGGSPSFPSHARRKGVECSPGTFVFWDYGYNQMMPEMTYQYAAILVSRIISIIDKHHICIDLGHKSVAAESPLPRIYFLNDDKAKPIDQSEEHLVVGVENSSKYKVGDVFYGIPKHICPTVALYDKVQVIQNKQATTQWEVIARNRKINY